MTAAMLASVRAWSLRRWVAAATAGLVFALVVAVPTDLIDTRFFVRQVPPTWWAWPALVLSAVLVGMVAATYVDSPPSPEQATTRSWIGSALTYFAVGCPVCNKIVLVLLGTSGALTWFEPVQPLLQLLALALLGWALWTRVRGEVLCPAQPGPSAA